jgi:alpha-L-fucosidase 2
MSNNSISRKSSDYSDPVPAGREAHGEQAAGDVSRLVCCMPARDWREALPLGNGSLAALVYGRTAREVVTLNHEKLWGGASTLPLPDVSDALPDIRRALADGHYQAAENLLAERLVHEGYYAASPGAYMPGPDLLMQSHGMLGFSDYGRTLNMAEGEVTVTWVGGGFDRRRRSFVSEADAMFVHDCGVPEGDASRHDLHLEPHDLRDSFLNELNRTAISPEVVRHEFAAGAGIAVDLGNGCKYIAAFCVRGARHLAHHDGILTCDFSPEAMVLCSVEPVGGAHDGDVAALYFTLESRQGSYEELFARRFVGPRVRGPVEFDLGCTMAERTCSNEGLLLEAFSGRMPKVLVERLFHYGRYLLGASSRPGGLPAHLQGKWNGEYAPPWSCAYFNNENLQMSYWQALPGNMSAALLPVFDLYESLMEDFRENARNLFGCRGILLPLYNSPFNGRQADLQAHVLYWTGAGAWLAQLYWEYWLFTRDRDFLTSRAEPFIREVALFYRDFLQIGTDGKAVISPGNSPENRALPHLSSVCINATMDVALVRELLTNLLAANRELGKIDTAADEWKRILKALPNYQVDETGAMREWLHPDFGENHQHRHISHIYPFFPGHEIPPDPEHPLFGAVHEAVKQRMTLGLAEQTGWSLTHLANIFARLGEGTQALECLARLAQSCLGNTFFTYHNDTRGMGVTMDFVWGLVAPLQLDAIFGFPAAVMEMLLYSSPEEIRLLPALPNDWASGRFAGWQTRCGVEVACRWDKGMIEVDLKALRAAAFRLSIKRHDGSWLVRNISLACGEMQSLRTMPDENLMLVGDLEMALQTA